MEVNDMQANDNDIMVLKANQIDVASYLKLRASVGWKELTRDQAQKALDNSLYTLGVYLADQPIGMGRIVGDASVICYIQDLIIHPHAQRAGVGNMLMKGLIAYVESITPQGTEMMLDLMCAKGREIFYEQHGFIARPTDTLGPGMIMYIDKR